VVSYSLGVRRSLAPEVEAIRRREERRTVVRRIASLAQQPRPEGCERLASRGELYRVRLGCFRIVYSVDDAAGTVHSFKVGWRRTWERTAERGASAAPSGRRGSARGVDK
jgi:mRNA interferase RelE/StbE